MEKGELEFNVRTYECQPDGSMNLHCLMHHVQEIAYQHAERYDFGYSWMERDNVYWILINFRMDITRLPRFAERIKLLTWPSGYELIKAFREFHGFDEGGNELFRATSEWMILDRDNRMPRRPDEFDFHFPKRGERLLGDIDRLRPDREYTDVGNLMVPYTSIDLNGHVNNTEYVKWGVDAVRRLERKDFRPLSFHISFNAEVFEGEIMKLMVRRGPGDLYSVRGVKENNGKNAFIMEIIHG